MKNSPLSLWKMETSIWKSKNTYPAWHGAIAITLSMIVAALAGYAIIVYVAPWFNLSINWDDTNTNYETLFVLVSYVVGAVFFTLIISFLNAEKIEKTIKEIQKVKALQSEKFEITNFLWESLKKYPQLEFLGCNISSIDYLQIGIKNALDWTHPTNPEDHTSYQVFKNETDFSLHRMQKAIESFSTKVNRAKEKVERANKVADAIRELSNLWLLGIITATIDYEDYYSKDVFPIDHIKLLLRYLDEGGDDPIVHGKNTHDEIIISENIFEKISQGVSLYQKKFLKTHYLDSYLPAIKINPFSTIPEWLKEWQEL